MYKVILQEGNDKIWESWYGLMSYGENKAGNIFYRWSFVLGGRYFHISAAPRSFSYLKIEVST